MLALALIALGFFLMHFWPVQLGWLQLVLDTFPIGVGFGLVVAPLGTSTLNAAGAERGGVAAAVVTAARMIGMILGLAALTSWGLARFNQLLAATPLRQRADATLITTLLHQVYTEIFLAAAVLCVVALLPAALLWRKRGAATLLLA
jgi:hypothetical protein